jgi:membrane-associated protease RseP (regulator of RpoE activity)
VTDLAEAQGTATDPGPARVDGNRDPSVVRSLIRLAIVVAALVIVAVALGAGDLVVVIAAILLMVALHELGHFVTAKWSHMKVTEFFIGFGPRLWSVRRGETVYGIKAIPAGAYVKIPGMTNLDKVDPADEPRTYRQQPFAKRILVASAGSLMHLVMAFVLAWAALVFIGGSSASTVVVEGFTTVQGMARSPAQLAGLRAGDRIVSVDGKAVTGVEQLSTVIRASPGKVVVFRVDRGGRQLVLRARPVAGRSVDQGRRVQVTATGGQGFIGVELGTGNVPENPFGALGGAGVVVGRTTVNALTGLGHVFSPHGIATYVSQVTSPQVASQDQRNGTPRVQSIVGAVRIATQGAEAGALQLMEVLIALNIFIGIANMLPMLPLDGGHVLIAVYERIRTRRGRPYYQADAAKLMPVAYAFVFLLLLLVSSAVYLDITHPVSNPFG